LDKFVGKAADVFAWQAFSKPLRMILQMTQELLLYRIQHGKREAMKCCPQDHLPACRQRIGTGQENPALFPVEEIFSTIFCVNAVFMDFSIHRRCASV